MTDGRSVAQFRRYGMVAAVAFIPRADKLAELIERAENPAGVAVAVVCGLEKDNRMHDGVAIGWGRMLPLLRILPPIGRSATVTANRESPRTPKTGPRLPGQAANIRAGRCLLYTVPTIRRGHRPSLAAVGASGHP